MAAILNFSKRLTSHAHLYIVGNVIVIFFKLKTTSFSVFECDCKMWIIFYFISLFYKEKNNLFFAPRKKLKLIRGGHFEFQ